MGRRLAGKVVSIVAVLLLVTSANYLLIDLLPGDPALVIAGMSGNQEAVRQVRKALELDRPLPVRYVHWVTRAAHGDLGRSRRYNATVAKVLKDRFPRTIQLIVLAEIVALAIAVPLGLWAGVRAGTRVDRIITGGAFGALAIPSFVLGLVLVVVFAVHLHWLPSLGYVSLTRSPFQHLRHMIMPAVSLGLPIAGIYLRALRADVANTMLQDHVVLARANGLSTYRIVTRHVLRQSSLTMLTQIGISLPWILSFVVLVEKLFNTFGAGELLGEGVAIRDFGVVQGTILAFAVFYVLASAAIDAAHGLLDPRIRRRRLAT
jgi:peptide/nickel transport system permease protein